METKFDVTNENEQKKLKKIIKSALDEKSDNDSDWMNARNIEIISQFFKDGLNWCAHVLIAALFNDVGVPSFPPLIWFISGGLLRKPTGASL